MNTNEQLKSARLNSGLTQKQLAEKIGSYQANIADIESGKKSPSLKTIQKIVDVTGISIIISKSQV